MLAIKCVLGIFEICFEKTPLMSAVPFLLITLQALAASCTQTPPGDIS